MKITDILHPELIKLDAKATSKEEIITELASLMAVNGYLHDQGAYMEEVLKREALGSTGVGMGVAIPHGKCEAVKKACVAFAKSEQGVDFQAPDGPARLIFLIAVPASADNQHLKILAKLSRMLIHQEVREQLEEAVSVEKVLEALKIHE